MPSANGLSGSRLRQDATTHRCRWKTAKPCICTPPIPVWGLPVNGPSAPTGNRISWSHGHDKGAVALRGSAVDLLLAVVRRVPVADTDIAVFGDAAIWQHWLDHTPF